MAPTSTRTCCGCGSVRYIWRAPHKPDRLDAYPSCCSAGIQAEALIARPGFARFLPIAALLMGKSSTPPHRDAGVARGRRVPGNPADASGCSTYEAKLRVKEQKRPSTRTNPGIVRAMNGAAPAEPRGASSNGGSADCCARGSVRAAYGPPPGRHRSGLPDRRIDVGDEATQHAALHQLRPLPTWNRRILVHMGDPFITDDGIEACRRPAGGARRGAAHAQRPNAIAPPRTLPRHVPRMAFARIAATRNRTGL